MPLLTGTAPFEYEIVDEWVQLPDGWTMNDVADVGVDRSGLVYLFNRGVRPVIVCEGDGRVVAWWGDKTTFPNAHALTMGLDDTVWLTDSGDHTVRKCSLEGEILLTLGRSGKPAPPMSGRPFNRCTHVAIHPGSGDVYVSDGYGNAAVHRFSSDGRLLSSWGRPGNGPGEFNLPHNLCIDRDGFVYVADRHNMRVQVFTGAGELEHIWYGMSLPCGLHLDPGAHLLYMTELSSGFWASTGPYAFGDIWNLPGMGPRVSIWTLDGVCQAKLCDVGEGTELGQLLVPHGLTVDAQGSVYIGMISWSAKGALMEPPRQLRNIQKLQRVGTPITAASAGISHG